MASIWTQRHTNKPGDPTKCRASVTPNETFGWLHSYQCTRKPTALRCVEGVEYGFCKQHDPEVIKARDKGRREQWDLEWNARERQEQMKKQIAAAMDACKAAIEQIATGHNDPRMLAVEALKLFPAGK